jgi:hypothetical protein
MIDYILIAIFALGCLSPLITIAGHREIIDPASKLGQDRWLYLRTVEPYYINEIAETVRYFKTQYLAVGFISMLIAFILAAVYERYNGLLWWSVGCFTVVFWGKWASKYVSFYHWVYVKHNELLYVHATADEIKQSDIWLKILKVIERPLFRFEDSREYITDVPLPDQYAPFYYHVVYRPGLKENPIHEMLLCSQKQIDHVLFHDPEFVRLVLNAVLHLPDVVTGPVTFVPVFPQQSAYSVYYEHQHPLK